MMVRVSERVYLHILTIHALVRTSAKDQSKTILEKINQFDTIFFFDVWVFFILSCQIKRNIFFPLNSLFF